ncbi:MAG: hypothetical protein EWV40_06860 [Microcystis flos-aquae Mf_WU_F_19750830_S460]|uniref:Uncharacterized protein n=1 Tax=Microcystis flos-aquae Mf_WU_F_19750830_S460 TaxID=2486237 RepID=A0A552LVP9_9CHRO|nr:MAG: hypothetical protein EWV40_06860 [Microcystis flos-aquae Mf_WU_F_19750830_S460]
MGNWGIGELGNWGVGCGVWGVGCRVWGVGELSGFDYPGRGIVFPIIEFFLHFFNNLLHL